MAVSQLGEIGHGVRQADAHWYRLYGLSVHSEVTLPLAASGQPVDQHADLEIRYAGTVAELPTPDGELVAELDCPGRCHGGDVYLRVHRSVAGGWFTNPRVGACFVAADGHRIDVYALPNADARALGLMVIGQVSVFALNLRGCPSLHASAISAPHGAAVFLGRKGQGKSTMTASFLHRGHALLTDDILPISQTDGVVCGTPGPSIMKVWDATAEHTLAITDQLPTVTAYLEKKLLQVDGRYAVSQRPVPLRAIYWLQRYDPSAASAGTDAGTAGPSVQRLSARDGVALLLAQSPGMQFLRPAEVARFLPLYARLVAQAPVRILTYPNGFEYQDAVCAHVLTDLELP